MAWTVQVPVYTEIHARINHKGRVYTYTGKYATRNRDGALVFEYSHHQPAKPGEICGMEFRLWARADGTEIEED